MRNFVNKIENVELFQKAFLIRFSYKQRKKKKRKKIGYIRTKHIEKVIWFVSDYVHGLALFQFLNTPWYSPNHRNIGLGLPVSCPASRFPQPLLYPFQKLIKFSILQADIAKGTKAYWETATQQAFIVSAVKNLRSWDCLWPVCTHPCWINIII